MTNFGRHITVEIGEVGNTIKYEAKIGDGYGRIDFDVKKYGNGMAYGKNTAEIKLYNVAEDKFKSLIMKEQPITLKAGYEGKENIIFQGTMFNALRMKENATDTDVIVSLLCSAGLQISNQGIYKVSYGKKAKNSPQLEIKQFIKNMFNSVNIYKNGSVKTIKNITPTFIKKLDGTDITGYLQAPLSYNEDRLNILTKLAQQFDFTYQIEENGLIIRPNQQEAKILKLTPEDGLIGIPEITEQGINFKTFLNPNIEATMAFTLESKYMNFKLGALEYLDRQSNTGTGFNKRIPDEFGRYTGSYRIIELSHRGSSHSNEWETQIIAQDYKLNNDSVRNKAN